MRAIKTFLLTATAALALGVPAGALAMEARFTNLSATGPLTVQVPSNGVIHVEVGTPMNAVLAAYIQASATAEGSATTSLPVTRLSLTDLGGDQSNGGSIAVYQVDMKPFCDAHRGVSVFLKFSANFNGGASIETKTTRIALCY